MVAILAAILRMYMYIEERLHGKFSYKIPSGLGGVSVQMGRQTDRQDKKHAPLSF